MFNVDESDVTRLCHFPVVSQNVCADSKLEFLLMKGKGARVRVCVLRDWCCTR